MLTKDRCWSYWADFPFQTRVNRQSFALIWHDANNLPGAQDLPYGHGDGFLRHILHLSEPAFIDLLFPARFVEVNHQKWLLRLKISRRIIESKVPIFSDTSEQNIHRLGCQCLTDLVRHGMGISLAVEKMVMRDSGWLDKPVANVLPKACGMSCGKTNIFVQMKKLDALPVETGNARQRLQKLQLGCSCCRNQTGISLRAKAVAKGIRRMLGCGAA
jgi:hypothetical protein